MRGSRAHLLRFLSVCGFLAVWEGAVRLFHVPAFVLPPPSAVFAALWQGIASGILVQNLWITCLETLLGFLAGSALALALGTVIALSRNADFFLYPYVVMFQSLPKVALAPIIVVWFGLGLTSKVVNAALIAFFPLMINTISGLRAAEGDRINLMRSLAASRLQIFWMLQLPSALPFIMAGLEIALIFSLIGAIVAEFVGAESGLGMLIQSMNLSLDVAGQFSVLLVLSCLGLLLSAGLGIVRRRFVFWDKSAAAPDHGAMS